MSKKQKTVSHDKMIDKHSGKVGTENRDAFENELSIDFAVATSLKPQLPKLYK